MVLSGVNSCVIPSTPWNANPPATGGSISRRPFKQRWGAPADSFPPIQNLKVGMRDSRDALYYKGPL